jgi:hypothetical protein
MIERTPLQVAVGIVAFAMACSGLWCLILLPLRRVLGIRCLFNLILRAHQLGALPITIFLALYAAVLVLLAQRFEVSATDVFRSIYVEFLGIITGCYFFCSSLVGMWLGIKVLDKKRREEQNDANSG